MKIVTSAQMVAIEQAAERAGASTGTLMENAGLAVAQAVREALGAVAGTRILVLVGPGNNGADGLVTARHLRRWGGEVTGYVVAGRPGPDPKMALALDYDVSIVRLADDPGLKTLDRLVVSSRMVIDAVLGTGRARPLTGNIKKAMLRLRQARASTRPPLVMALDLPTGLNPDTGEVDSACAGADITAALGFPKRGLLASSGLEATGRLAVLDIGVPSGLPEEQEIGLEMLTADWVARRLPARPLNSHKGAFGHALVIAGSRNYVGAAYLASQASVRTGAGLTTLASPLGVYPIAAAKGTEAIHLPLPEDGEGRISPEAAPVVHDSERTYSAILVGCGLGLSPGTTGFLERLLFQRPASNRANLRVHNTPVLIDADGLNNLAQIPDWPDRVDFPLVLTPHPGEMSTLTGLRTADIQRDRVETALEWADRWNVRLVLKGANTVIAAPGGTAHVAPFANPGLASGGTGDVLSGVIAGLMAQGLPTEVAACCGVYLHGLAAEQVTSRLGVAGLAASDLLGEIPSVIKRLTQSPI